VIRPGDFGISEAPLEAIQGGELGQRVAAVPEILTGDGGPASDIVALNAGAILCVSGAVSTIADGVDIARKAMSDQRPIEVLHALVTISQQEAS
jgi:anthranilate phosphoribosyltransferase